MSNKQWNYHQPVFECDQWNPQVLTYSPWVGHRRFAYDYIRNIRPAQVVELGSYYGCSAFAFLQAIKDGATGTDFCAIDTWQGDDFTKDDYREDIYGAYKSINDRCFGSVRSRMLRCTFDEAVGQFPDESIDLLHIDGSHAYEDVKHDYTLWRGKVAPNGVIFFHDVGEDLLFGQTMGSHIFWEELKREQPWTLEFPFSNGLGLLFLSRELYERVRAAADLSVYQRYINLQDTIHKDDLRKNHFRIRDQKAHIADLERQIGVLNYHLEQYRRDTAASAAYIGQLEEARRLLEGTVREKTDRAEKLTEDLAKLSAFTAEKEQYITQLESQMASLNDFAREKSGYAESLAGDLAKLSAFTAEKEQYIAQLESQVASLNDFAREKSGYAEQLAEDLAKLSAFTGEKEQYITQLESQMASLNDFAREKSGYAEQLAGDLARLSAFTGEKERYISELESQIASVNAFAMGKDAYAARLEDRLRQTETESAALVREKQEMEQTLQELTRRLQKLPFGSRLLKDLM